jgi:hypothetical protein
MLPATLQFLIVAIASVSNDRLQRKLDYVEEERRILGEQLDALSGGNKIFFTADSTAPSSDFRPGWARGC